MGLIEVIEMQDTDPWIFLNQVTRGHVRDANGKWTLGKNDHIGLFAFESMTSFSDALMTDMAKKAGAGVNIGGGANVSFSVSGDGETLKISGSNVAHYGVCQTRITEEVWQSQKLDAQYVLWTASVSKDDDLNSGGKVLGPAVVGKALTAETPRWFDMTFRIDCVPAQMGKPERHVLYLGTSVDMSAGNATILGNIRTPLDAPPLPLTVEPADLVKALELIEAAKQTAASNLKKRLGLK
jgi:hypothetical protein